MSAMFFKKAMTLAFNVFLFEDDEHPSPGESPAAQNEFAAPYVLRTIEQHYKEELKPPQKWNYYFGVLSASSDVYRREYSSLDFRHPTTNEIIDQRKYLDFCREVKTQWAEWLQSQHPKYNAKTFEAAMEKAQYDYYPKDNTIVISALLPGLVKGGPEVFKYTKLP
jgi:hypothetical protein